MRTDTSSRSMGRPKPSSAIHNRRFSEATSRRSFPREQVLNSTPPSRSTCGPGFGRETGTPLSQWVGIEAVLRFRWRSRSANIETQGSAISSRFCVTSGKRRTPEKPSRTRRRTSADYSSGSRMHSSFLTPTAKRFFSPMNMQPRCTGFHSTSSSAEASGTSRSDRRTVPPI